MRSLRTLQRRGIFPAGSLGGSGGTDKTTSAGKTSEQTSSRLSGSSDVAIFFGAERGGRSLCSDLHRHQAENGQYPENRAGSYGERKPPALLRLRYATNTRGGVEGAENVAEMADAG